MNLVLIACLLGAEMPMQGPAFFAGNEEERGYLLEAAENHPALRARYEEWRAAMERVPQMRSLDDPMFSFGWFVQSMDYRAMASIGQAFPWFGTRGARADQASAEAEMAMHQFYGARNELFAEVKAAYAEYGYVAEAKRVYEAQAEILRFIEQIAETRYGMGLTAQFEYLRIQIERSRAEDRIVEFDQMRGAVSARLSRAVGRTSDPELPWPEESVLPPQAPPGPVVLARMHQMNPVLAAMDAAASGRDIGVKLARKKSKPDFMLEFEYTWMKSPMRTPAGERALGAAMGTRDTFNAAAEANALDFAGSAFDAFSAITDRDRERARDEAFVSLSINLPIWRKKVRAGVAEARYMSEAARSERHSMQLDLENEAREALFRLQNAQRSHRLYDEDLLPKAQLALEGVQSAFGAGDFSVEVRDVLDGVNTLLDLQLERLGSERDWRQAAAELEMVMGGPWTPTEDAEEAQDVGEEKETAPGP